MRMFSIVEIGERAGSGMDKIFGGWEWAGHPAPTYEVAYDPDRTTLILPLVSADSTSDGRQKSAETATARQNRRFLPISRSDEELDEGWNDSEADPVDIPCPGCGKECRHYAPTLVNARKNPELRDRLIKGTLFEFTCPQCGYTASLVNPCLYLDPTHRASVYLVISDEMADGAARMFDDLGNKDSAAGKGLKRIVFDRHDLRGRAIALEEGFDDRAIEILKMAVSGSAKIQGAVPADDECIVNLTGVEDGDLVFDVESGNTSFSAIVPRGGYELYRDAIRRASVANEQPYFVNRAWAHHAIDALDAEGLL